MINLKILLNWLIRLVFYLKKLKNLKKIFLLIKINLKKKNYKNHKKQKKNCLKILLLLINNNNKKKNLLVLNYLLQSFQNFNKIKLKEVWRLKLLVLRINLLFLLKKIDKKNFLK